MQAARRRRRGASRSPKRSSGDSPRREPDRACPRTEPWWASINSGPCAVPWVSSQSLRRFSSWRRRARRSRRFAITAHGRVRVIVGLGPAPLAAVDGRTLAAAGTTRKLDVTTTFSRRYLAHVGTVQRAAAAQLVRAIPQARIGRRFQVVLDGLTVSLPF